MWLYNFTTRVFSSDPFSWYITNMLTFQLQSGSFLPCTCGHACVALPPQLRPSTHYWMRGPWNSTA